MTTILLLHSILGLRSVEQDLAKVFRAAGHRVETPDLFGGAVAATVDEGFALRERLGNAVERDLHAAAAALPRDTVLCGLSFGAGLASELWRDRPETAGVLLLHGVGPVPESPRPGTSAALHLAEPDPFEDEEWVDHWREATAARQVSATLHRYLGVGHLFTDATLPDHDAAAAALLRERTIAFLASLDTPSPERPLR